jgi:hypothetical protein
MAHELDIPDVARVIPTGEPVEAGSTLFQGTLEDVREFVQTLPADQQAEVAIWTPSHIFTVAELLAERPGHELDPEG